MLYNAASIGFLALPIEGAPAAFGWTIVGFIAALGVVTHVAYRPRALTRAAVDAGEM
jgi:hypothetical protein